MIKTAITSDLHFFHKKIMEYCPASRPFRSVTEMNDALVDNINNTVDPDGIIYILGDVSFGTEEETYEILKKIRPSMFLIQGNHDKVILNSPRIRSLFVEITSYHEIKIGKKLVCMFHYPIAEWNRMHNGSIMLHGHTHGARSVTTSRITDVGVDTNNCFPYNLETLVEDLSTRPI